MLAEWIALSVLPGKLQISFPWRDWNATALFYLPTSFGDVRSPKNTMTPPANCTEAVTKKAYWR